MTRKEYNTCVTNDSDKLFSYAVKLVKKRSDAQDLVQYAFMKLWEKRNTIDFDGSRPFLYRVIYNKMIDNYRKNKRMTVTNDIPESSISGEPLEERNMINLAFAQMKDKEKHLILLKDWEGYSYDEISEILDLNLSQVKVYLFRARKKMKKILVSLEHNDKKKVL